MSLPVAAAPGWAGSSEPRGGGAGGGSRGGPGRGAGTPTPQQAGLVSAGGSLRPSPPGFTACVAPSRQAGAPGREGERGGSTRLGFLLAAPPEAEPRAPASQRDPLPPGSAVPSPAHPWGVPGAARLKPAPTGVPDVAKPPPPRPGCCWTPVRYGRGVPSPSGVPSGGDIPIGGTGGCRILCWKRQMPESGTSFVSCGQPSPTLGTLVAAPGLGTRPRGRPQRDFTSCWGSPAPRLVPGPTARWGCQALAHQWGQGQGRGRGQDRTLQGVLPLLPQDPRPQLQPETSTLHEWQSLASP